MRQRSAIYDLPLSAVTNRTVSGYNIIPESEKGVDAEGQRTKNAALAALRDTFSIPPRYAELTVRSLGGMTGGQVLFALDAAARAIDGSLDTEALIGDIAGTDLPTGSAMKNRAYDSQRDARRIQKTRDALRSQGRTEDAMYYMHSFDGFYKAWSNKRGTINRMFSVVNGVSRMNDADLKGWAQGRGSDRKEMEREAMATVARRAFKGAHQVVNNMGLTDGQRAAKPAAQLGEIDAALKSGNLGKLRTLANRGVLMLDFAIATGNEKAYKEAANRYAEMRRKRGK